MKLDASEEFFKRDCKIFEALYLVTHEIAKQKKPHTIAEKLIKPCVLKIADIMLRKDAKRKTVLVSLSNGTFQRI